MTSTTEKVRAIKKILTSAHSRHSSSPQQMDDTQPILTYANNRFRTEFQ